MWDAVLGFVTGNWKSVVIGILVTSALGYVQHLRSANAELKQDIQQKELRIDSIEAVNDTTREINGILADSLRFFERRVLQVELERDSLDEALDQESRVRANTEARVDSLQTVIASTEVTEDSAGVRHASFNFYEEPFTVDAQVAMPPPPSPAKFDLNVKLDPIPLSFRVGCRENPNTDVKRAIIGITTPDWAEVELKDVQQEPGICNPQFDIPEEGFFKRNRGKIGLTTGAVITTIIGFVL